MSNNSTILVVEDDAFLVKELYKNVLRDPTWLVDYVESRDEAMERIAHNEYDLAIVDIMLREDTRDRGGLDVIRRLRETGASTDAIVVSATDDIKVATDAFSLGVKEFMRKEDIHSGKEVSEAVRGALRRRSGSVASASDRAVRETLECAATEQSENLTDRFIERTREWKRKSRHMSSPVEIAMLPEYQEIVGMGPAVLGLILTDLQDSCDHWFWALRAIVGRNPFGEVESGSMSKMREAWLSWGKERGLI